MASKVFVLLGLFAVLLVVSEVAAASDRLSGTVKSDSKETVQPDHYGGPGGGYGGGGNYNGGGHGGGNYNGGGHGGGNYNGGGHGGGNYNGGGHGGGNYNGGGHGGGNYNGGGHGGFCRHGCCYRGYRSCSRCCSYAGEAVQTQPGH